MAIVSDITNRALRLLRVLDPHEAAESQDFATALVALNALAARWEADGLALGWSTVDNPEDALPAPVEAEEALAYNLAIRLRAEYGVSLDPDVVVTAREGLSALLRDRLVEMPLVMHSRLSRGSRWNIVTDSPY